MSGTTFWHRMIGEKTGFTNLGVLRVLTVLTDVLDGKVSLANVEFETTGQNGATAKLTNAEVSEITELLGAITARILKFHNATLKGLNLNYRAGLPAGDPWHLSAEDVAAITEASMIDARANVESQLRNYLMNSESKRITYTEFRALLGL